MARYQVLYSYTYTVTDYVDVEAHSQSEAIQLADDQLESKYMDFAVDKEDWEFSQIIEIEEE